MNKEDLNYLEELSKGYLMEWAVDYSKGELEDLIQYLKHAYKRGQQTKTEEK